MQPSSYIRRLTFVCRCLAVLALAAAGVAGGTARATHIAATLVAQKPGTPGGEVMLALAMVPAAGWHGYWSNPGDAGFPARFDWTLPARARAGEPRYPVPQTLVVAGLTNHVYESAYAVLVPLTLPADARPGASLPVRLRADWLACTEQVCVPERAELTTQVQVVAPGTPTTADPRFADWIRRLPAPLGAVAHVVADGDRLRLGVPLPAGLALDRPHFFAAADRMVAYGAEQRFSRVGDLLVIDLARAQGSAGAPPARLDGVLRLDAAGDGLTIAAVPGAVPPAGAGDAAATGGASLAALLGAALLGGLLLNIMPCVFPILSLKALSLARAGGSEAHARAEGLAYTAGVVLACLALGGLLLALRAAGEEVGWAFQLQQPGVVAALLLLAVAVTANLAGLFEFAVPGFAGEANPRSAFATGLLAAFVATPCTGPFMAAAMGAALLLPVPQALALFAALGLGLALPFLAIALIPALRRLLPRPGAWMATFRRVMAVPMALTALALLWLASRLGGWSLAALCALLAVVLLALLAWTGQRQRRGLPAARGLAGALAALAAAAIVGVPASVHAPAAETAGILPTHPFSEPALAAARAGGHPVFAWFTADWCLTCKVNEQLAIERPETRDAFARAGVTVLRGDWTRRDPAITRYLTAQGAAGVPLYVWYPAGGGPPRTLPQVLTPAGLAALTAR